MRVKSLILCLFLLAGCAVPVTREQVMATGVSQGMTEAAPVAYAQALTQIANGGTPIPPLQPTERYQFLASSTIQPTPTLPGAFGSITVGESPIGFYDRPGEDAGYLGELVTGTWLVVEKAAVGQYFRVILTGYLEKNDIQVGFAKDIRTACVMSYLDDPDRKKLACNAHLLDAPGSTLILAKILAGAPVTVLKSDPSGGVTVRMVVWVKSSETTVQAITQTPIPATPAP